MLNESHSHCTKSIFIAKATTAVVTAAKRKTKKKKQSRQRKYFMSYELYPIQHCISSIQSWKTHQWHAPLLIDGDIIPMFYFSSPDWTPITNVKFPELLKTSASKFQTFVKSRLEHFQRIKMKRISPAVAAAVVGWLWILQNKIWYLPHRLK